MHEEMQGELYLYHLLRRLFLSEPTRELVEEIGALRFPPGNEASARGIALMIDAVQVNVARLDEWLGELAVEYARVFIGPGNPPAVPYASFYLSESRQLMTEDTIEVRKRYLEAGMAINEMHSVPDDHIGIELEFLYYLTLEIATLQQQGRQTEAPPLATMKTAFLVDHLLQWVPEFARQVVTASQEDFYRGAALLLEGSLLDQER